MRETFKISGRSFSINAMYGPKKFKTAEARDWEYSVLHQLNSAENLAKFERLRSQFDVHKHAYAVCITVYYPEHKFITKDGTISAHTHDVSNYEKPLVDLFFLPKYFSLGDPYGCKNLNCDDKFITRMYSRKCIGPDYGLRVSVKIINR
jgi:hypothetical protein